jgi:hypothetical protein
VVVDGALTKFGEKACTIDRLQKGKANSQFVPALYNQLRETNYCIMDSCFHLFSISIPVLFLVIRSRCSSKYGTLTTFWGFDTFA